MELHHYKRDRREEENGEGTGAFKPVLTFKERCFGNTNPKYASFLLTLRFYFLHIRLKNLIYCPSKEYFVSFHEISRKQSGFSTDLTA